MNITFSGLLFLLFLGLQLSGYIAWPWIWVTAPLWVPLLLFILLMSFAGIIACIAVKSES